MGRARAPGVGGSCACSCARNRTCSRVSSRSSRSATTCAASTCDSPGAGLTNTRWRSRASEAQYSSRPKQSSVHRQVCAIKMRQQLGHINGSGLASSLAPAADRGVPPNGVAALSPGFSSADQDASSRARVWGSTTRRVGSSTAGLERQQGPDRFKSVCTGTTQHVDRASAWHSVKSLTSPTAKVLTRDVRRNQTCRLKLKPAHLACGGVDCSMGIRMWRSMRRRCWWCRSGSPPASAAAQASGPPGSASGASRAASPRIWYDSSRPCSRQYRRWYRAWS